MSILKRFCFVLLIGFCVGFESNITRQSQKCFQVQPDSSAKGKFIVNYQIPLEDDSLKLQIKNTENYTLHKSSQGVSIEMRAAHEICFSYDQNGKHIQMEIGAKRKLNATHWFDLRRVGEFFKGLKNSNHFNLEEYVREIQKIPGWIKVLIVIGIIAINTRIYKWWRRRHIK